jgi:hypothetical protein
VEAVYVQRGVSLNNLMPRPALLLVVVLFLASGEMSVAQNTPWVEVFGGYSNLQAAYNGWDAAVALNPARWFGVVADGSGYYTSSTARISSTPLSISTRVNASAYAALFGPQLSLRRSIVHLFARGLVGPVHLTAASPALHVSAADTQNGYGGGLGLDIVLFDSVAVRLFQMDYLRTNFANHPQDLGRISGGIVIHLGTH